jgi:hypothetical protein
MQMLDLVLLSFGLTLLLLATAPRFSRVLPSRSNKKRRRSQQCVGASGEPTLIADSPELKVPGTFAGILVHHEGPVRRVEPAYRPQSSRRPVRI